MRLFTIDFETYYDNEYSLTKMSTEDYVADPRFEVILVGIKCDDRATKWFTGTKAFIGRLLKGLELEHHAMLAHNTMFDALILDYHFGIKPKLYTDTRLMAQALLKPYCRSVSLKNCLEYLKMQAKGTVVEDMRGRTRGSLTGKEMAEYGSYCVNDCDREFELFNYLRRQMPASELELIDLTLRMYMEPRFVLDANVLAECLALVRAKNVQLMNSLPGNIDKSDLMSNPKLAEILKRYGIDPPLKISPITGKATLAFAKTDPGWKELEEEWDDHPEVGAILAARIGAKSTLEETRGQRLLDIANRHGVLRVPLLYYGAHTGRYSGTEKINAQNLPKIDKSRMRFALCAPKGYVVVAADLAQIEARITAWLAGQKNLIEGFRRREDIYSDFATTAYGVETVKNRSPEDNKRRFVGKTCILGLGYGMSDARLKATLRKDDIKLEMVEAARLVNVYRTTKYPEIPKLWRKLDGYIETMATGAGTAKIGPCTIIHRGIHLPSGMALIYHNLRYVSSGEYNGWAYNFSGETRTMWGGKLTENIVQALARTIIMDNMRKIRHTTGIKCALQQHDELDYVIPASDAESFIDEITKIMQVPPVWAPDLPVEVEVNYGPTLGHCK